MQTDAMFFEQHPEPMWIYEIASFRFLRVNQAAILQYGYSRDEFLAMSLVDIRPEEDVARLFELSQPGNKGRNHAGIWRHRKKSGEIIHVRITAVAAEVDGHAAKIVSAVDVSDLIAAQGLLAAQAEREKEQRQAADATAGRFKALFESIPSRLLILAPGDYEILAVSDTYLGSITLGREELIGRRLFDVFPDAADGRPVKALSDLRASLQRVEATRETDLMTILHHPLMAQGAAVQAADMRYWSRANHPVLGADGSIAFIIHQVEDVSEHLAAPQNPAQAPSLSQITQDTAPPFVPAILSDTAIRQANLHLRQQDESFRTVQRLLAVGMWRLNLSTARIDWSDNFDEVYGVSASALANDFEGYLTLVHPDDRCRVKEGYESFLATGNRIIQFQHRILRRDGGVVHVRGVGEVAQTFNGPVLTGVVQDVTPQETLTSHLKLLEASVSRLHDVIVITEPLQHIANGEHRIVFANEAFCRSTGLAPGEATGLTSLSAALNGASDARIEVIRKALTIREPARAHLIELASDFVIELDVVPVTGAGGQASHWIHVLRDVTDRRRAEAERLQADERFRIVTEATSDIVRDWDLATGDCWWSSGFPRLYGHRASLPGEGSLAWSDNIHPEDRDRVMRSITEFISGAEPVWYAEYRFLTADRQTRWVADRAVIIRDAGGRGQRLIASLMDLTEKRDLEERLRQKERLEAIGELTGGLAHYFNNMLTVIIGNSDTLADRLPDGPMRQMAELILSSSLDGAALIRRLQAFARRQPLQLRPCDINEVSRETAAFIRKALPESIDLRVRLADSLWISSVDAPQLQTALLNLCLNARDAMPKGGTFTFETANEVVLEEDVPGQSGARPGPYVSISLTDTGTGMTPEVLARVYEPFFTTKPGGQGSGFGLSMVYGFMHQLGGFVTIASSPGQGTCVRLCFPRWTGDGEASGEPAAPEVRGELFSHVLVVEDTEPVRVYASVLIRDLGMKVSNAEDANEALTLLKANADIDLLFTDIGLPGGKDGIALSAEARALRPDIKVLFTTGYAPEAFLSDAVSGMGELLLVKPYRREDLERKLRALLQRH